MGPTTFCSSHNVVKDNAKKSDIFLIFNNGGKIQGDGRKFLDRFKSYFGSQISSQSLNEVHIYRLQPKSATKGDLFIYLFIFHIVLSLIVSVESASRIANSERSRRSAAR